MNEKKKMRFRTSVRKVQGEPRAVSFFVRINYIEQCATSVIGIAFRSEWPRISWKLFLFFFHRPISISCTHSLSFDIMHFAFPYNIGISFCFV